LLFVSVARISTDIGHELRLRSELLLATVFEFIEARYHEPISLATIAELPTTELLHQALPARPHDHPATWRRRALSTNAP